VLTDEQELTEPLLRVDQVTVDIEKMRADIAAQQKTLEMRQKQFETNLVALQKQLAWRPRSSRSGSFPEWRASSQLAWPRGTS
jgi:hypothetical protein